MWTRAVGVRLACCALLLGACSTATDPVDPDDAATDDATTDDAATEDDDFDEPEVEQPGTEEPAGGEVEQIALELPGLPIGGDSEAVSPTLQCAQVNWSGPPDLIEGVHIEVTAVSFEPPGAFRLADEGCPGADPPCLPIMPTGGAPCTVAIAWTGEPVEGEGELLFTEGHVICAPEAEEECTEFQQDVAARGPDGIELEPPPEGGDGTGDGSADGSDTAETETTDGGTETDPGDGSAEDDGGGTDG